MTIKPDTWLYPGYAVKAPDGATTNELAAFARQFALWAESKRDAEKRLKKLNSKVSR